VRLFERLVLAREAGSYPPTSSCISLHFEAAFPLKNWPISKRISISCLKTVLCCPKTRSWALKWPPDERKQLPKIAKHCPGRAQGGVGSEKCLEMCLFGAEEVEMISRKWFPLLETIFDEGKLFSFSLRQRKKRIC